MKGKPEVSTFQVAGEQGITSITLEILTPAQIRRRADWMIARATINSPIGTYGGHEIHNYCDRGRLSVQPARGSFLHEATKTAILEAYREATK